MNALLRLIPYIGLIALSHQSCVAFDNSAEQIIRDYVLDFRKDRFAEKPRVFGVNVSGQGKWHVIITGEKKATGWDVNLRPGPSPNPTFCYELDFDTLTKIATGRLNAMTAQAKASSDDDAPMRVVHMDGFVPTPEAEQEIKRLSFHFWTRGFPEVISFGPDLTRPIHGSNAGVFYYEKGLRTGWYCLQPGDKARSGPRERPAPFPILAIGISGVANGEIAGQPVKLPAGNAVFIPPGAQHRWWNETDEVATAIIVMFGEGA